MLVIAAALLGCAPGELPEGHVVTDAFLRDVSPVRAHLAVPCADAIGGHGAYEVEVDDRTGMTVLLDREAERMWLRDGFGVVSDRCWWLPLDGADPDLPDQDCAPGGHQTGACGPDATAPTHWRWLSPGVVAADGTDVVAVDGTALLPGPDGLERFDLTGTADPPIDPGESPGTRLSYLSTLDLPGKGSSIAAGDTVVATYSDDGGVVFFKRTDARRDLDEPLERRRSRGRGEFAAAGDTFAVAADSGVDVWSSPDFHRERRDHRALRAGVIDVAINPTEGTPYVLVPAGVVAVGPQGALGFWPVVGAQGLFVGYPAGVPTIYAWGNDDAGGVVWRLEPDGTATGTSTGPRLLGAGTGSYFQEIVLVEDGDPPVVRGVIDQRHLDAIAPGTVGLALAAFVESPKDPEIADAAAASLTLAAVGGCPTSAPDGFEQEHEVCCAQAARGERLDAQLAWLDDRMRGEQPIAVVLGVSPTAIAVSRRCAAVPESAVAAFGEPVPAAIERWLGRWQPRGVASAAVFIHSGPFDPSSWWVGCPDLWPTSAPPTACWDVPRDEAHYRSFYDDVTGSASLAAWGNEPDWRLLAGGFGTEVPGGVSWPDVLPALELPDGAPAEDGLFFGNLGMDPRAPAALAKEMAPEDAMARAFPMVVQTPADRWDGGGTDTEGVYWPGQTFALEYLAEQRRSGLLMQEYIQTVSLATDWEDPTYAGDEALDVMTAADFAFAEHYLVARVLAARDVGGPRFWTVHLGDLSRLRDRALYDGWIACNDAECADTALDDFARRVSTWPQVAWRPRP